MRVVTYKLRAKIYHIALKLLWFFCAPDIKTTSCCAVKNFYSQHASFIKIIFFAFQNTLILLESQNDISKVNGAGTAAPNSVTHITSIIQHGGAHMEISNNSHESKLSTGKNEDIHFKAKLSKNRADYLNVETVRKMILRFLSEKQISKQKLAEALGITEKSLLQICLSRFSVALIPKINLPLVKLYCRTKF